MTRSWPFAPTSFAYGSEVESVEFNMDLKPGCFGLTLHMFVTLFYRSLRKRRVSHNKQISEYNNAAFKLNL